MDNKKSLYFFEMISPFIIPLLVLIINYIGGLNIDGVIFATLFLSSAGGTVLSNCYSLDSFNKPIFIPLNVIIGFITIPLILVFDNLSTKVDSTGIYYIMTIILCFYSLRVSYKNLKLFFNENEERKQTIQTILDDHKTETRNLQENLRQQRNTISTLNKKIRLNEIESLLDNAEISGHSRKGLIDSLVIDLDDDINEEENDNDR